MAENRQTPVDNASQLQEAIDVIVQSFDHPATLSIEYTCDAGTKQTAFEIQTSDGEITYELHYNGSREKAEPKITQRN